MHRRVSSGRRSGWASIGRAGALVTLALVVVAGAVLVPLGSAAGSHVASTSATTAGVVPATPTPSPSASAAPAATTNATGPCIFVTTLVCVALYNLSNPNIIPAAGSSSSAVDPDPLSEIQLVVKSETGINWSGSPINGPNCPVALNLTATLWNGAPYYSTLDGTTWHSASQQWYVGPLTGITNKTYPYWYVLTISPVGTGNQQQFFAGMSVTWWIALTYNTSGTITHVDNTPRYTYTYSSAWPWSPDPGARQYAGASAFAQDLSVAQVPSAPNWNDSVHVTLNLTHADALGNATIGSAFLDLTESLNHVVIESAAYQIPQTQNATGATALHFLIPASFALRSNATVEYQVGATDYFGDEILSPMYLYAVGSNGSFATHEFSTDLSLVTSPNVGSTNVAWNGTLLAPGVPIQLTLTSNNAPTAINAAEVAYTVTLPEIGVTTTRTASFDRVNSTVFTGTIPAMPVGAQVNYTVLAWDFSSDLEVASGWNYTVASIANLVPTVPTNESFFYVGIYDAGLGTWANDSSVLIHTEGGFFRSQGSSYDGLAYANASGEPFQPLVGPANATYVVNITDATFHPVGGTKGPSIQVSFVLPHTLTGHHVIVTTATYQVVMNGDLLLFYLNGTVPTPTPAPAETASFVVGSVLGLVAAAATALPLYAWWSRIAARREAEIKRVTL